VDRSGLDASSSCVRRLASHARASLGALICAAFCGALAVAQDVDEEVEAREAPTFLARLVVEGRRAGEADIERRCAESAAEAGVDPWEVTDEIVGMGDGEGALAFARAVRTTDREALVSCVQASAALDPQTEAHEALHRALRALDEGTPSIVAMELEAAEAARGTPLWVRQQLCRARADAATSTWALAAARFAEVAGDAGRLGWRAAEASARLAAGTITLEELHDPARARVHFRRAVDVAATLGNPGVHGTALRMSGVAAATVGDLLEACALYERAADRFREAGQPNAQAGALANLGVARYRLGRYAAALDAEDDAWRVSTSIDASTERAAQQAWIHVWYAVVHQEIGGLAKAERHLERAAALLDGLARALPRREAARLAAYVHGNRALVLLQSEDLVAAGRASKEALQHFEYSRDTLGLLGAYANAARIRAATGDVTTVAQQGSAWQRLAEAEDPVVALAVEADLAEVYMAAGLPRTAEIVHRDVLARAAGMGLTYLDARQWAGLALAHAAGGDDVGATLAARMLLTALGGVVGGLGDEEAGFARERFADAFHAGGASAARIGDASSVCLLAEAGRAGALLESLGGRERLREVVLPAEERDALVKVRESAHAAYVEYLGELATGHVDPASPRRAAHLAAQDAIAAQVARMQRRAKSRVGLVYPTPDDLPRLQAHLREDEALVLYVLPTERAAGRTRAIVVEKAAARVVDLGDAREIARLTQSLVDEARGEFESGATEAVAARVVRPLGLSPSVRTLIVSPEGDLAYLPWAALVPERLTVAVVPSGTTLGALRGDVAQRGALASDRPVLGVGDPDYSVVPGGVSPANLPWSMRLLRLPRTEEEVRSVAQVRLLRRDATERRVREEAARLSKEGGIRALHLAAHGIVNVERPLLSCVALTADPGGDDGYLTVVEAMQLSLRTDLVVLSACESGRGGLVRGEGVFGLVRAFMVAGAPRVIASLWKVDDRATRALMEDFYRRWTPQTPAAQALHDAQMALREAGAPPRDWAAWVLWGLPD
jgi:CHAT domain-containing protein/tetratricopeptide (TPR) repeat protein